MNPETVKRMLGEFAALSAKESKETAIAHFKGGEPLVYPDLEELALFASRLGLEIFITTNGLAVSEKIGMFEEIRDSSGGKLRVTLSLNGSKPDIDALLRVDQKAFFASVEAARMLASAGITFDINYIVHEGNVQDLAEMAAFARELGVAQLNVLQLILAGRAGLGKAEPVQMLETLSELFDSEQNRSLLVGSLPDFIDAARNGKYGKGCVAGFKGLLYVKSNGDVFSCPSTACSRFLAGNIQSASIQELMGSSAFRELRGLEIAPGCKGDALTGGEQAKKLRRIIEGKTGKDGRSGKSSICIQKNF